MVLGLEDLIVVGITSPEFIHPAGIWRPCPVTRSGLGPRVFDTHPVGGDLLGGVIYRQVIALTEEIHAFQ